MCYALGQRRRADMIEKGVHLINFWTCASGPSVRVGKNASSHNALINQA